MAEDFKSLREVAHAIYGLNRILDIHTKVLAIAVAAGVAATGFLYWEISGVKSDVGDIKVTIARIEERINGMAGNVE